MVDQDRNPDIKGESAVQADQGKHSGPSFADKLTSLAILFNAVGIVSIAVSVAAGVWRNASHAPGTDSAQWGLFFTIVGVCAAVIATIISVQATINRRHENLMARMEADRQEAERRRESDRREAERKHEADRREAARKHRAERREQADFRASVDGVLKELRDMNGRQSRLEGRLEGMK